MATKALDMAQGAFTQVSNALSGVGTHVNTAVSKLSSGIETEASGILTELHAQDIKEIEKNRVIRLTNKALNSATWAQNGALAVALASYVLGQYTPILSTFFKVGTVASLLTAYDFKQVQDAVWEVKKHVKHSIAEETVTWVNGEASNDIIPIVYKCTALMQNNLLFLNRSLLFGQEINELPDYIGRRVTAATNQEDHTAVKWIEDRSAAAISLTKTVDGLKGEVTKLIGEFSQDYSEAVGQTVLPFTVQNLVKEVLRPLAFSRATGIVGSLSLYTLSVYTPIFSSLTFIGSVASAFFALEAHRVHEAVRSEVSQPLLNHWVQPVAWNNIVASVKNGCLKAGETTWLFNKNYFFGREIAKLPQTLTELYAQEGNFESEDVSWVKNSMVEKVTSLLKNWTVYIPGLAGK